LSPVVRRLRALETICGVSSDLTGTAHGAVSAIWGHLERRHGLRAMRAAANPHVTYAVGVTDDPERLRGPLTAAAAALAPFTVAIDGPGVFESARPVLFRRVRPSRALARASARLRAALERTNMAIWPHYPARRLDTARHAGVAGPHARGAAGCDR
jgi:hypothetical protein